MGRCSERGRVLVLVERHGKRRAAPYGACVPLGSSFLPTVPVPSDALHPLPFGTVVNSPQYLKFIRDSTPLGSRVSDPHARLLSRVVRMYVNEENPDKERKVREAVHFEAGFDDQVRPDHTMPPRCLYALTADGEAVRFSVTRCCQRFGLRHALRDEDEDQDLEEEERHAASF